MQKIIFILSQSYIFTFTLSNSNFSICKNLRQRYNNKLNNPIYSYKKTSLTPKSFLYETVYIVLYL